MIKKLSRVQKIKESKLSSFDNFAKKRPPIFGNIRELLNYEAQTYNDKAIYIYRRNKQEITVSYKQFQSLVEEIGTGLSQYNLMGKTTVVIGETCVEYMATYQAVVCGNGIIVPLDKELPIDSIIDFINLCEAEVVVYTETFNGKLVGEFEKLPKVKAFIPIIGESEVSVDDKTIKLSELIQKGREALDAGDRAYLDNPLDLDKLSVLLFTSGTTGSSKGVMLSHFNLISAINASVQSTQYDEESLFLDLLPVHHSYEMTCAQFGIAACGGTMYINDSVRNTLRNLKSVKPKDIVVVPLYLETIRKKVWSEIDKKGMRKKVEFAMKLSEALQMIGIDKRNKLFSQIRDGLGGNIRTIVCGGAAVNPKILYEFDRFGMPIYEGYGITECAPLVAVNRSGARRYGSVGQPVSGVTVKIDNGGNSETGEILVKGDNVMMGYYKNEEATREVFTSDGFFRTGDIGYIDEDGYIFITGRKKNVIILSNGKNVFPEELEERLLRHDEISEVVVLARNDVITAVIYPNREFFAGKDEAEIKKTIKEIVNSVNRDIAVYKHINEIEIRNTEFEKTTTKKIKRFLVK